MKPGSFEQVLLATVDPEGEAHLSDHCPISVVFETDVQTENDAIAQLLARLDAVQAELAEIRAAISALRE